VELRGFPRPVLFERLGTMSDSTNNNGTPHARRRGQSCAPANPPAPAPLALAIDPNALAPIIAAAVRATLDQISQERAAIPEGIVCFTEAEAAGLLKLEPYQLRDERRRGRISACEVVGRRIRYLPGDLQGYLESRRIEATARE
jgi:hypothetical protein